MKAKFILQSSPATFVREDCESYIKAGQAGAMVVNFSDYTYSFDSKVIHAVREIGDRLDRPVSLILGVRGLPETDKDFLDLEFGIKARIDYVLLPIVRSASEVDELRKEIAKISKEDLPVIARVANARASAQLKQILKAADGVMLDPGEVVIPPGLPKEPDSMIIEDLKRKTLGDNFYQGRIWLLNHKGSKRQLTIVQTLLSLAEHVEAKAIVVSDPGLAAQFAWARPSKPDRIIFASNDKAMLNRWAMLWGIEPLVMKGDLKSMLKGRGFLDSGDRFVDATRKAAGVIDAIG